MLRRTPGSLPRTARHGLWTALVLLGIGHLTAAGLDAQLVTGTVTEASSTQPVAGAFVVLEDSAGTRVDGVLTNGDGDFTLEAPAAGTYQLLVEVIGFQDHRTGLFAVSAGGVSRQRISLETRAIDLLGIRVEARPRCRATEGLLGEVSPLWDEARKALSLARWGEEDGALSFEVREHLRVLDASNLTLLEEADRQFDGLYRESPYRSLDPERLAQDGYIQEEADGELVYYAPDAEVLLSDAFLDTHCFYATESQEDPDLVGLAFRPVPGRTVPDVRGVLWLSRATAELQRLEFSYVETPSPEDWEAVGGQVEFARLGSGVWVVDRWHIRMPRQARREGGVNGARTTWALVELLERGATTTRVRTESGEVIAEATWGSLSGTVRDRVSGEPVQGVTVTIPALGQSTRTAAGGAYRFGRLPPGMYSVELDHPSLRILGFPAPEHRVEVGRSASVRGDYDLGLSARAAAEACGAADEATTAGDGAEQDPVVLFGRVDAELSGSAERGAVVMYRVGSRDRRVLADSLGLFRTCVPGGETVQVAAVPSGDFTRSFPEADAVEVSVPSSGFARVDVSLSAPILATRRQSGARGWENALLGTVRDADTGRPLDGVAIQMLSAGRDTLGPYLTDEEGRFRIPHPREGEAFTLEASQLGYGAVAAQVAFASGEEVSVEVRMSPDAVEMEPIVVTARRRGLLAEAGYYDRRERGLGQFIEREEIERRAPTRPTDLFQGLPGVSVINIGPFGRDVRLNIQTTFRDMASQCQPKLVLDGVVVRAGGAMAQGMSTQGGGVIPAASSSMDDLVNISNVEAMEVYTRASAIPPEYGGLDTACGVILFWTRRD